MLDKDMFTVRNNALEVWSNERSYKVGKPVIYGNEIYRCIGTPTTIGVPPSDEKDKWKLWVSYCHGKSSLVYHIPNSTGMYITNYTNNKNINGYIYNAFPGNAIGSSCEGLEGDELPTFSGNKDNPYILFPTGLWSISSILIGSPDLDDSQPACLTRVYLNGYLMASYGCSSGITGRDKYNGSTGISNFVFRSYGNDKIGIHVNYRFYSNNNTDGVYLLIQRLGD